MLDATALIMNKKCGFRPSLFHFAVLMLGSKNWLARRAQVMAQLTHTVSLAIKNLFCGLYGQLAYSGLQHGAIPRPLIPLGAIGFPVKGLEVL